jgi:NADPH-dependent curcumin reductase CurA
MKKTTSVRQKFSKITALLLAVLSAFVMLAPQTGLEAHAAGKGGSVAVNAAMIQGANVVVTATGAAASDDGIYHLYAQQPFEAECRAPR